MSRRYWSSDPSSYDDFLCDGTAIRTAAPASGQHDRAGQRGWALRTTNDERELADASTNAAPPDVRDPGELVRRVSLVAVIDNQRPALHQGIRNEAPVPAVVRIVPIVAEHEIISLWDDQRTPVVTRGVISHTRLGALDEVVALPPKFLTRRVGIR